MTKFLNENYFLTISSNVQESVELELCNRFFKWIVTENSYLSELE